MNKKYFIIAIAIIILLVWALSDNSNGANPDFFDNAIRITTDCGSSIDCDVYVVKRNGKIFKSCLNKWSAIVDDCTEEITVKEYNDVLNKMGAVLYKGRTK